MSLPKEEADILLDCLRVASQHEDAKMRKTMARNIEEYIQQGKKFNRIPIKHIPILFFPNDQQSAKAMQVSLAVALKSGECSSKYDDRLSASELAAWPACPQVPADSPLHFWVSPTMRASTQVLTANEITLPAGTVHVEFEEVVHLMAKALSDGKPQASLYYVACQEALSKEFENDVDSGALPVKNPLTLKPESFAIGNALQTARVMVTDFRALAAARGIDVIVKTAYEPTESDRAALRARIDEKEKYLASLSKHELRAYRDANGMSNVSLAPRPLDSLRSSGYHEPKKPPPIDWSHWRLMPQVLLREAVALSVNLNPETLKFDKEGKDFQDRLRIAISHVAVGNLQLVTHYPENERASPVLLAVFATWAVSQSIKTPSELAAMATAPIGKSDSDTLAFVTPLVNARASEPMVRQAVQGVTATSGNEPVASDYSGGIPPERVFVICAQPLCVDSALRALPSDITVWAKFYWGVTRDGGSVRQLAGRFLASDAIEKIEAIMKRQVDGYFTVNEAAQVIADARDMKAHKLVKLMLAARENGKLKIRDPEAREVDMPADAPVGDNASLVKIVDVCKALEIEDLSDQITKPDAPVANANSSDTLGLENFQTNDKPWEVRNTQDPNPKQDWYTPARYFARQLVIGDSTLLTKKSLLASSVVQSLSSVGIKKRGGVHDFDLSTIKKAFIKIKLS